MDKRAELSPTIIHLERYLGRIEHGWESPGLSDSSLQIVQCGDGEVKSAQAFCTLGLSDNLLKSAQSGKNIRQEIFVMVKKGQLHPQIPAIIHQVAIDATNAGRAILRGETIRKLGSLAGRPDLTAIYATLPIYYPKEFWTLKHPAIGEIAFCWMLPITTKEVSFLCQNGWSSFEELLDNANFDLFDLDRPSLL